MSQLSFQVTGMSCAHCERRVQETALSVPGALSAKADAASGRLVVTIDESTSPPGAYKEALAKALEAAQYPLAKDPVQAPAQANPDKSAKNAAQERQPLNTNLVALASGGLLIALMIILDRVGVFSLAPSIEAGMGYGALLLAGFLTSFHCIAMCGGIALSQSLGRPVHAAPVDKTSLREGLSRTLAYNAGRVVSYTLIGAIVGALGASISPGPIGRGVLMGVAGLLMVYAAAKLFGLIHIRLPRFKAWDRLQEKAGAKALAFGPFAVGLANGFMPCGPLQAMQLYALGTGSALAGALTMLAFSVGTVPVMAGFGVGATFVKPSHRLVATKAGAVLVAFLGLATVSRAWAIAGLPGFAPTIATSAFASPDSGSVPLATAQAGSTSSSAPKTSKAPKAIGVVATLKDGYQEAVIKLGPRSYGDITVLKGVPVRFIIQAEARTINGCNNALFIPAFSVQKGLMPGDNLIEFTPATSGLVPYTCWMGMIGANILVVDELPTQGDN